MTSLTTNKKIFSRLCIPPLTHQINNIIKLSLNKYTLATMLLNFEEMKNPKKLKIVQEKKN